MNEQSNSAKNEDITATENLAEEQKIKTEPDIEEPEILEEAVLQETSEDLAQLQSEIEEYRNQYLRGKAEVENIRRRSEQEVANARKYGVERFARELLDVRDSLDQASTVDLEQDNQEIVKKMQEGLLLTLKQTDSLFDKFSITVVVPEIGEKFDPESHQAMSLQPSTEVEANHILMVIQNGYRLHDRLLRPAMVIVAKSP